MNNNEIKPRRIGKKHSIKYKINGKTLTDDEIDKIYETPIPKRPLKVNVNSEQKMEAMKLALEIEKIRPKMIPPINADYLWEDAKHILNIIYD